MEFSRALVTGGAGFIGSHLVDALVSRGCTVTVIDKVDPAPDRANANARYVRMDIKDPEVRRVCEDARPEVVFHLAAHIDDRASVREPVMNAEENVLGSLNVFAAAQQSGTRRVIFTSTGVVYGNVATRPIPETIVPRPLTPYGVSKLTGERYLHFYWLLYKMSYAALRLSNVYGPRQDTSTECGAIAIFTSRLLRGEEVALNNDGMTTRDYVYVDDVIAALLAAADADAVGVVNIGTGIETTTAAVLDHVASALNMTPRIVPRKEVEDAVKHVALSTNAARTLFGWEPKVAFADGILRTVAWYKEHPSAPNRPSLDHSNTQPLDI